MKKITLSFLIFYSSFSFSQNCPIEPTEEIRINSNTLKKNIQLIFETFKNKDAGFFLDNEWQGGNILLNNNVSLPGYLYRYNIYTDEIEMRSIIKPDNIEYLSIGNKIFMYSSYFDENNLQEKGYFEVLVKGDCRLLLKRSIKKSEGDADIKLYGAPKATSVIETYYIKKENNPAYIIEKSKSSILKNLSDKKAFSDYVNNKLLLIINENKLEELIDYYNKL